MAHGVGFPLAAPLRTAERAGDWLATGDRALFGALLLLQAAPLVAFPYFPTRDGPAHLEGALLLLRYDRPEGAALREWLVRALPLAPNWLDHVLLAGLCLLFPPAVAERVLVAVIVFGLPLAARRALEVLRPGSGALAVLTLPFTYSWLLHMGFYNFCLGLALFFLTVGSGLRARVEPTWRRTLALTAWATALYFTHPVPLLAAALVLGLVAAWDAGAGLGRVTLAFLPSAVLLAHYVAGQRRPALVRLPAWQLLRDLAAADVLVSFDPLETVPAAAVGALFALLFGLGLGRRLREPGAAPGDAMLAAVFVFVAALLSAPVALAGGQYVTPRLMLFPFFALVLWLGTLEWPRRARAAMGATAALITVCQVALHATAYRDANEELLEYASAAPSVAPGRTVLPLQFSRPDGGEPRVDVLAHAGSRVTAERGSVDLTYFEATKRGIFPFAFRADRDPYHLLGGNPEEVPPCVDLRGFEERTGTTVDYVIAWRQRERDRDACGERTLAAIRDGYDLVHVSAPRQLLRVWRRRKDVP